MKVTNNPFTLMISVSLHLVNSSSSCVRLCLSIYFVWSDRAELVGSVGGGVRALNKLGGRKKMHSVFEGLFPVPIFISRQNWEKWLEKRVINLSISVLDSKKMQRCLHIKLRR